MTSKSPFLVGVVAVLTVGCAGALKAQTKDFCRAPDETAQGLRDYVVQLAAPSTDKLRATAEAYGILAVPAEQVAFITEENLCRRAARRYAQELDEKGKLERAVYLIRIGEDRGEVRYIAFDPDHRMGEYRIAMVLDRTFKVIASFTM